MNPRNMNNSDWEIVPDNTDSDWEIVSDEKVKPSVPLMEKKRFNPFRIDRSPEKQQEAINVAKEGSKELLNMPRYLASGVIKGLGRGGETAAKLLTGGYAPSFDESLVNQTIRPQHPSALGRFEEGFASYFPYGIAGGASLLGQLGAGAGYGAAMRERGEQNALGFLPKGKIGGALEGALINALTHGAFKGIEALRPSRLLRGTATPEELQQNVEAAEGTPTGLGDVIQSPFLKRQYENILSKFPLSTANQKMQEAASSVIQSAKSILDKMSGGISPEDVTDEIYQGLLSSFRKHQSEKNRLYDEFNKEADKQILDLRLPRFSKEAKKYRDAIMDSNILKYEPDVRKIFSKLEPYTSPVKKIPARESQLVNQFGEKMISEPSRYKLPTAKEANILKGKLRDYAERKRSDPSSDARNAAGVFDKLSNALKADINEAVEKSGNQVLKQKYQTAEKNYAEHFSPFMDKEIYKFIGNRNADPDTILQSFLKATQSADRHRLLSKLTSKLSEKQRRQLGYAYFSRAIDKEGNLNLETLSKLIRNLGKKQFEVLVPDKNLRNSILKWNRLYKLNPESIKIMQNLKTGQRTLDILPALSLSAGSSLTGNILGGPIGALAGLVGPGLASRPIVNYLSSPAMRKTLVDKMIKGDNMIPDDVIKGIQGILQGKLRSNQK